MLGPPFTVNSSGGGRADSIVVQGTVELVGSNLNVSRTVCPAGVKVGLLRKHLHTGTSSCPSALSNSALSSRVVIQHDNIKLP